MAACNCLLGCFPLFEIALNEPAQSQHLRDVRILLQSVAQFPFGLSGIAPLESVEGFVIEVADFVRDLQMCN
jgi:hypothetical protein